MAINERPESLFNWREPNYTPIIAARADRLQKLRRDPGLLRAVRAHYAHDNPADFISDWMWTYDPRRTPSVIPFLLFPKQREYIEWLLYRVRHQESGLTEKSRDMGITWLNMAFALWMWNYWPGAKIAFGSRKEALVDRAGDPDSIFEKGRMILRSLPQEFVPNGYVEKKHATHLRLTNPETGNTITGESGDNIGRGGRSTLYLKDESAFYERPERIEAALSQNANVKIDCSTPNGAGNPFYTKRHSGNLPVFTFHWLEDPRKNLYDESCQCYPWYEKQKREIDNPVIIAQEIDIDYEASTEDLVIPPEWVRAAVELDLPISGLRYSSLDVADDEGKDVNAQAFRNGVVVQRMKTWNGIDTTKTTRRAHGNAIEYGANIVVYDSIGVGAGVKGEATSGNLHGVTFVPFNAGANPLPGWFVPPSKEGRGIKNSDLFLNLRAHAWWSLRIRFEKTYRYVVEKDKSIPIDDLISIPNRPQLISELSRPKWGHTSTGKIKIESKEAMAARGIPSTNEADAVMQLFKFKQPTAGTWGR